MAFRSPKLKSTLEAPDYSKTRVYKGSMAPLEEAGFTTISAFVEHVNAQLALAGKLPVSCGDYPSSEKKLQRLIKRWRSLSAVSDAA